MKRAVLVSLAALLVFFASSCSIVADIFKAGMGFGIFIVVVVIVLILWLVMRGRRR